MTPPVHPFARALRLEFDRRWSPASVRPPLLPASWPPPTDAELEARAATTRTWSRERPVLQLPPALPFHRPIDDDPTYKALLDSMTRSIEDDPDPLVHNADGSVTMPHPISAPTKRRQTKLVRTCEQVSCVVTRTHELRKRLLRHESRSSSLLRSTRSRRLKIPCPLPGSTQATSTSSLNSRQAHRAPRSTPVSADICAHRT